MSFSVIFKFTKTTDFNLWKIDLFSGVVDLIIENTCLVYSLLGVNIFFIYISIKIAIKMTYITH